MLDFYYVVLILKTHNNFADERSISLCDQEECSAVMSF